MSIPGAVVTDAASVYDHLHKTGSVPKERQVLIDLLTVRDLVEENVVDLRWIPTAHMLADILTKPTGSTDIQRVCKIVGLEFREGKVAKQKEALCS